MPKRSVALGEAVTQDSRLFAEFDADGKLSLDLEEFISMVPGPMRHEFSSEELGLWFAQADRDGNGILTVDEYFLWSLTNAMASFGANALASVFAKLDNDDTGQLDALEFGVACQEFGFGTVADTIFKALDADGGGTLSLRELLSLLRPSKSADPDTQSIVARMQESWNAHKEAMAASGGVDAGSWVLTGRDAKSLQKQLQTQLRASGCMVADLLRFFDADGNTGSDVSIGPDEFVKGMRSNFGFRGPPKVKARPSVRGVSGATRPARPHSILTRPVGLPHVALPFVAGAL